MNLKEKKMPILFARKLTERLNVRLKIENNGHKIQ